MTPFSFFEIVLRFLALLCLVNTLIVIIFRLETPKGLFNVLGKFLLIAGSVTAFAYLQETLLAWVIGNEADRYIILNRLVGKDYFWAFWLYIVCTGIIVQALWMTKARQNAWRLLLVSLIILASIWFSRYIIVGLALLPPS